MFTYNKTSLIKTSLLTLLLTSSMSSHGTENHHEIIHSETDQHINQLMQVTGLKHALDSFPQEIRSQLKQHKISNPGAALSEEESSLLLSQFEAEKIHNTLKQHLNRELGSDALTTLLNMHNDPLMKSIIAAEIAASSEEMQKEMTAFVADLNHQPPTEKRTQLMQQLDRTSMSTESVISIVEMLMLGMSELMMAREGTNNDNNRQQMQTIVTRTTQLIEVELRQQIIMSMHYIYRDFSDEEIAYYTEQLKRDESRHFTRAAIEGIGIVIFDAFKHGIDQLLLLRNARSA